MEAAGHSLAPRMSPGRPVTARWKGQLAESEMEEVVVGIKAKHSCFSASQRLLRCVSARSTGDPTGVYPQLCKLQTSIICLGPSSLDPPHVSLKSEAEGKFCKSWKGGDFLFCGWWTSSLCFTSPTPSHLAHASPCWTGLDRQTMDWTGRPRSFCISRKQEAAQGLLWEPVSSLHSLCVWW